MKIQWINEIHEYDGSQLRPLYAYSKLGVLGDSIISWAGPCSISFANMVDLEDVLDESEIAGAMMLHFIVEMFNPGLIAGVSLQRLLAGLAGEIINQELHLTKKPLLTRDGDDLFWGDRKLSISICSQSSVSTMIHFALNITNEGTPVDTVALNDFSIQPQSFAERLMSEFQNEYNSILVATKKVKPLS